jgi:hypothetical protein
MAFPHVDLIRELSTIVVGNRNQPVGHNKPIMIDCLLNRTEIDVQHSRDGIERLGLSTLEQTIPYFGS